MPTISRFYGILIRMYFDDKHAPHFHAIYGEHRAQITVADGKIMQGHLPPHAYRLVVEWAQAHRAELEEDWKLARAKQPLKDIEPLE